MFFSTILYGTLTKRSISGFTDDVNVQWLG
jgi:hypothetical protein